MTERVAVPPKLAEILDKLFSDYINALVIGTAAIGLEGEWSYDPQTRTFVKTEVATPLSTPSPPSPQPLSRSQKPDRA